MSRKGLTIATGRTEPNTLLTVKEILEFDYILEDCRDRSVIKNIIREVRSAHLREQYGIQTELDRLEYCLTNPKYSLQEITSTLQGILFRLEPVPTGGRRKRITPRRTRRKRRV